MRHFFFTVKYLNSKYYNINIYYLLLFDIVLFSTTTNKNDFSH